MILPKQHHPMDRPFIRDRLRWFPYRLARSIAGEYSRRKSRRERNLYLLRIAELAEGQQFQLAGDEDAIRDWARARAARWSRIVAAVSDPAELFGQVEAEAANQGLELPEPGRGNVTPAGVVRRFTDPQWWRRAARKRYGRGAEGVAIRAGVVAKWREKYASDDACQRRHQQKSRNRAMLEECQAVNELGQVYTLAELSDLSVSNPIIRRSELMVRIAGFEEIAIERGDVGEFITWTCPSRYHAHSAKYDGSSPRKAARHLQKMWSQCRAKLARQGLRVYGLRVAEPHKDGCPHWHMLLFMPADQREAVLSIMRWYALKVEGGEEGAKKNRFKAVTIDPSRGSAAGYVAKYVSKNIDGFGVEQDLFHGDPVANANRVDAWASTWGIRQFQFIGGPSVGVWRELRRLEDEETGIIEAARAAADASDWAAYVRAQGGPFCGREQAVKLAKWEEFDALTGELKKAPQNQYGEARAADVFGVTDGCLAVVTRIHEWEVARGGKNLERQQDCVDAAAGYSVGAGLASEFCGALASSWSPVNNCTADPAEPPGEVGKCTYARHTYTGAVHTCTGDGGELPPEYLIYRNMVQQE